MTFALREVKRQLSQISESLIWEIQPVNANTNTSRLTNANKLRNIVDDLEALNLFTDQTNDLKNSILFSLSGDNIKSETATFSPIVRTLSLLKVLSINLLEAITKILPDESEESINIKLPPINDFNDLANASKDFHTALSQVLYLDEINASMRIQSVENGSIWLNVSIYGSAGITLLGSLVWAGVVISKAKLEGKLIEEQLRAYKIRTDSMEDVKEGQKKLIDSLIQAEAEHINSENFKTSLPENVERIKHSISLLADLLNKGAEIHPALVASEQVSKLFPDMKNLPTIGSKIKQIKE